MEKILAAGDCLAVRDLAVSGKDLIRLGIRPVQLEEAAIRLSDSFAGRVVAGYEAKSLFDCFK